MSARREERPPRGRPPTRSPNVRYRRRQMAAIDKALKEGDFEQAQEIKQDLIERGLWAVSALGRPVRDLQSRITRTTDPSISTETYRGELKPSSVDESISLKMERQPYEIAKEYAMTKSGMSFPMYMPMGEEFMEQEPISVEAIPAKKETIPTKVLPKSMSFNVPSKPDMTTKGKKSKMTAEQKMMSGKARRRADKEAVRKAQEEAFLRDNGIQEYGGVVERGYMPKSLRERGGVQETHGKITRVDKKDTSVPIEMGQMPTGQRSSGKARPVIKTLENIGYETVQQPTVETSEYKENNFRTRQLVRETARRMIENNDSNGYRLLEISRRVGVLPPSREPPSRPDKVYTLEGERSGFNSAVVQGAPTNISSSSNEIEQPKTYSDNLVGTSYVNMLAENRNEYSGMNPKDAGQINEEQKQFEEVEENKIQEDGENLHDAVKEIELLSGADKDSMFSATDIQSARLGRISEDHIPLAYPLSGMERGMRAGHVPNVDLSQINNLYDEVQFENPMEASEIGTNMGDRLGNVYRNMFGADESRIRPASSIMENIDRLAEQSNDWFGRDQYRDKSFISGDGLSMSDRFQYLNRRALNKDFDIGKFNHTRVSDKYIASQILNQRAPDVMSVSTGEYKGVAPPALGQLRGQEVDYKQPNRSIRGDAANLLKASNRQANLLENEFMP